MRLQSLRQSTGVLPAKDWSPLGKVLQSSRGRTGILSRSGSVSAGWPCILNVGSVPMKLYGFNSIPRVMLFSPDAKIVSSFLCGEELKEVLPKK